MAKVAKSGDMMDEGTGGDNKALKDELNRMLAENEKMFKAVE